ncbi:MAG: fasciclin domain-containing protein [Hymenobacteraceae bacterium]|nr:fasciclin domain-containing protein [Hymenobacteraceae bacterium]
MLSYRTRAILLVLGLLLQAAVVCFGQETSNASKSIMENISAEGNRPLLMNMLQHAGLTPLLTSQGNYTFLIPSEGALAQLQKMAPETARAVLSYHILEGKYRVEDMKDGSKLKTLQGETISVCRKKGTLLLDGTRITVQNQEASNGVWHAIDGILMPKSTP